MLVRSIEREDLNSDYLNLRSQLSPMLNPNVDFDKTWSTFINNDDHHTLVIAHDGLVVGTGSLLIERKLTGRIAGRIEDVVISQLHRESGMGTDIINGLIDIAKREQCYKVILSCSDKNIPFYNRFGFLKIDNGMKLRP